MARSVRKLITSITLTGGLSVAGHTKVLKKPLKNQSVWTQRGETLFYDAHTLGRYSEVRSGSVNQALTAQWLIEHPLGRYRLSQQIYGLWDKGEQCRLVSQTQGRWATRNWMFSLIHSRALPGWSQAQPASLRSKWSGILTWHYHQKAAVEYQLSSQSCALTGHVWIANGWKVALSLRKEGWVRGERWQGVIRFFPFKAKESIEGSFARQLDLLLLASASLQGAPRHAGTNGASSLSADPGQASGPAGDSASTLAEHRNVVQSNGVPTSVSSAGSVDQVCHVLNPPVFPDAGEAISASPAASMLRLLRSPSVRTEQLQPIIDAYHTFTSNMSHWDADFRPQLENAMYSRPFDNARVITNCFARLIGPHPHDALSQQAWAYLTQVFTERFGDRGADRSAFEPFRAVLSALKDQRIGEIDSIELTQLRMVHLRESWGYNETPFISLSIALRENWNQTLQENGLHLDNDLSLPSEDKLPVYFAVALNAGTMHAVDSEQAWRCIHQLVEAKRNRRNFPPASLGKLFTQAIHTGLFSQQIREGLKRLFEQDFLVQMDLVYEGIARGLAETRHDAFALLLACSTTDDLEITPENLSICLNYALACQRPECIAVGRVLTEYIRLHAQNTSRLDQIDRGLSQATQQSVMGAYQSLTARRMLRDALDRATQAHLRPEIRMERVYRELRENDEAAMEAWFFPLRDQAHRFQDFSDVNIGAYVALVLFETPYVRVFPGQGQGLQALRTMLEKPWEGGEPLHSPFAQVKKCWRWARTNALGTNNSRGLLDMLLSDFQPADLEALYPASRTAEGMGALPMSLPADPPGPLRDLSHETLDACVVLALSPEESLSRMRTNALDALSGWLRWDHDNSPELCEKRIAALEKRCLQVSNASLGSAATRDALRACLDQRRHENRPALSFTKAHWELTEYHDQLFSSERSALLARYFGRDEANMLTEVSYETIGTYLALTLVASKFSYQTGRAMVFKAVNQFLTQPVDDDTLLRSQDDFIERILTYVHQKGLGTDSIREALEYNLIQRCPLRLETFYQMLLRRTAPADRLDRINQNGSDHINRILSHRRLEWYIARVLDPREDTQPSRTDALEAVAQYLTIASHPMALWPACFSAVERAVTQASHRGIGTPHTRALLQAALNQSAATIDPQQRMESVYRQLTNNFIGAARSVASEELPSILLTPCAHANLGDYIAWALNLGWISGANRASILQAIREMLDTNAEEVWQGKTGYQWVNDCLEDAKRQSFGVHPTRQALEDILIAYQPSNLEAIYRDIETADGQRIIRSQIGGLGIFGLKPVSRQTLDAYVAFALFPDESGLTDRAQALVLLTEFLEPPAPGSVFLQPQITVVEKRILQSEREGLGTEQTRGKLRVCINRARKKKELCAHMMNVLHSEPNSRENDQLESFIREAAGNGEQVISEENMSAGIARAIAFGFPGRGGLDFHMFLQAFLTRGMANEASVQWRYELANTLVDYAQGLNVNEATLSVLKGMLIRNQPLCLPQVYHSLYAEDPCAMLLAQFKLLTTSTNSSDAWRRLDTYVAVALDPRETMHSSREAALAHLHQSFDLNDSRDLMLKAALEALENRLSCAETQALGSAQTRETLRVRLNLDEVKAKLRMQETYAALFGCSRTGALPRSMLSRLDRCGQTSLSEENIGDQLALALHPDLRGRFRQREVPSLISNFLVGDSQRSATDNLIERFSAQRYHLVERLLQYAKKEWDVKNDRLAPLEVVLSDCYPCQLAAVYREFYLLEDKHEAVNRLRHPDTGELDVSIGNLDAYVALALDERQWVLENQITALDIVRQFLQPNAQQLTLLPLEALESRLIEAETQELGTSQSRRRLRQCWQSVYNNTVLPEVCMMAMWHRWQRNTPRSDQIAHFLHSLQEAQISDFSGLSKEIFIAQYLALAFCVPWHVENNLENFLNSMKIFFSPMCDYGRMQKTWATFESLLLYASREALGTTQALNALEAAVLDELKAFPSINFIRSTKPVYEALRNNWREAVGRFFLDPDFADMREVSDETIGCYVALALDPRETPHPARAFGLHKVRAFLTRPTNGAESIQNRCNDFQKHLDALRQAGVGTALTIQLFQEHLDQIRNTAQAIHQAYR